jgi:amidase
MKLRNSLGRALLLVLAGLVILIPVGQAQEDSGSDLPFYAMRSIDFSFYDDVLDSMDPARIAELDDLILEATVTDLAAMLDAGQFTSYELTLYYLYRIRTLDVDQLNSIVDLNPNALEIAQGLDDERQSGTIRGPLHGIPIVLKDNIATGDYLYTTAGAMALEYATADRDAFIVSELRDAGAIILAKTNMTEWANWMHYAYANGYSAVGGQVVSPYGEWLDPSGSSTGSSVAVTENFAPIALGTETIGSIISPASRESVVGYKPSLGLVSGDYVIPISDAFDTAGPIGKSVTDVALVMNVLAGSDDPNNPAEDESADLTGADFTLGLTENALQGIRVGILAVDPSESDAYQIEYFALQPEVEALERAGAEVVIVRAPGFPDSDWGTLFSCDIAEGVDAYLQETGSDFQSLAEIREFNENHPEYIPYGQERFYEAAACEMTPEETAALADEIRSEADAWMQTLFETFNIDVLATVDDLFSIQYSFAGWPAISVPRGTGGDGGPTGLTFVAPYLRDRELLGYAFAFEQASHYRVRP